MAFVYLHVIWFALWCIGNLIWWRFDPFPFGLLTLIVSLEAIFLSTFVLLSQNRESARSDMRADSDFETNVLSEVWLEAVGEKLGVDVKQVHATAKDRIAQSRALASANGTGQATLLAGIVRGHHRTSARAVRRCHRHVRHQGRSWG